MSSSYAVNISMPPLSLYPSSMVENLPTLTTSLNKLYSNDLNEYLEEYDEQKKEHKENIEGFNAFKFRSFYYFNVAEFTKYKLGDLIPNIFQLPTHKTKSILWTLSTIEGRLEIFNQYINCIKTRLECNFSYGNINTNTYNRYKKDFLLNYNRILSTFFNFFSINDQERILFITILFGTSKIDFFKIITP